MISDPRLSDIIQCGALIAGTKNQGDVMDSFEEIADWMINNQLTVATALEYARTEGHLHNPLLECYLWTFFPLEQWPIQRRKGFFKMCILSWATENPAGYEDVAKMFQSYCTEFTAMELAS